MRSRFIDFLLLSGELAPRSLRPALKPVRRSWAALLLLIPLSHESASALSDDLEGRMREEERLLRAPAAQPGELAWVSGEFWVPRLALVGAEAGFDWFESAMHRLVEDEKARCESLMEDVVHLVDVEGARICANGDAWDRSKASAAFRSSIIGLVKSQYPLTQYKSIETYELSISNRTEWKPFDCGW